MISIIILTFNSQSSIKRTLASLTSISNDIHIVDSFSTDSTVEICRNAGCNVIQREFKHYADQRNWAIANLPLRFNWQLHIDADEELEPELIQQLRKLDLTHTSCEGFILGRKIVFLGRILRFGGISRTWHCRLFKTGTGRCEDRLYDQHFICSGKTSIINAFMLDHQEQTLSGWTIRHNRWSDLEVAELIGSSKNETGHVQAKFWGSIIERKRRMKSVYYSLPLFWRPLGYFLYRYLFLLGFLDGVEGLIFHLLQGLWFRFLIDAKLYEARVAPKGETYFR